MGQNSYADEALKRMYKENKSRVFVCSNNDGNNNNSSDIQVEKLELMKLIGIISKTDLFKVATEIEEMKKISREMRMQFGILLIDQQLSNQLQKSFDGLLHLC